MEIGSNSEDYRQAELTCEVFNTDWTGVRWPILYNLWSKETIKRRNERKRNLFSK